MAPSPFDQGLEHASDALFLTRRQVDDAFGGAASKADEVMRRKARDKQKVWVREHGKAARRKKLLDHLERGWRDSLPQRAKLQHPRPQRRRAQSKAQRAEDLGKVYDASSNAVRLPAMRQERDVALTPAALDGVTFERAGAGQSFEAFLLKDALLKVVSREGLMEALRDMLRTHGTQVETCLTRESRVESLDKELFRSLMDSIREATVAAVLSIAKWQNCFVEPRQFWYRGSGQVSVDYLLYIVTSLDFLNLRPQVQQALRAGRGPQQAEIPMMRNPLMLVDPPHALEVEATDILAYHERRFGKFVEHQCRWCGLAAAAPKDGSRALVPCGDQHCDRGRFCADCIKANCGGLRAYNLIKVSKTWTCFLCVDAKLRLRQEAKQAKRERASAATKWKQERARRKAAEEKHRREQLPQNKRRRRTALAFLREAVKHAQTVFAHHKACLGANVALAKKAKAALAERTKALGWLHKRGHIARLEVVEILSALQAQEALKADEQEHRAKAAVPLPLATFDSLDLFEQEESDHVGERKEAETQSKAQLEEDTWMRLGVRVNLRIVLRVVHFDLCLVRIVSTERNPEIVEVSSFIPRDQRCIDRVLLHKSQVTLEKQQTELLRTLRDKAHKTYRMDAQAWLRGKSIQAQELLVHNRVQHGLRQELCGIGRRAVAHRKRQWQAHQWLRDKGLRVRLHLFQQVEARKSFRFQARQIWKHQGRQQVVRDELETMANKVQAHLESSRAAFWELKGRANYAKAHLHAQQLARGELRVLRSSPRS